MSDQNVNILAEKYQSLRKIPGEIGGGQYDERIDSASGEKYIVMKDLGEQLGVPGTPAADILSKLGKPDKLAPTLDPTQVSVQTMPGPAIPSAGGPTENSANQQSLYFVYNLVPNKHYLYFKIDPTNEKVITSDWYKAE